MIANRQESKEGSQLLNNVDIKGDLTITNGMNFNEVKGLFDILMELNFPKLLEKANKKAYENINAFYIQLEQKMKDEVHKISKEYLASVDTQYVMQDVIKNVARKGEILDLDVVTSILIEKFKNQNNTKEENDILFNETLEVMNKLTNDEIKFLALIIIYYKFIFVVPDNHSLNIKINNFNELINYEVLDIDTSKLEWKNVLKLEFDLNVGDDLTYNKLYLKGIMINKYKTCSIDDLKNPILDKILEIEKKRKLYNVRLNDIGLLIGLTYLKTKIKDFDIMSTFYKCTRKTP